MNKKLALLTASMLIFATPSVAGNKLMPASVPIVVAKSTMSVTPDSQWNRLSARPGRNSESWTLDGSQLNDLTFYGGVASGQTLFREVDKRNRPLAKFNSTMLSPDIVQLLESSYRIALQTGLFQVGTVESGNLAGHKGVRFQYQFVLGDEVKRSGEGTAAVINGKLYMITFEAPEIFYFNRDIAKARAVVASARVG